MDIGIYQITFFSEKKTGSLPEKAETLPETAETLPEQRNIFRKKTVFFPKKAELKFYSKIFGGNNFQAYR